MPREYSRTKRVNVQLQREVADLIRTDLTDPRVAGVTVTRVSVSPDLANATVYVSVLGDDAVLALAVQGLNHASHRLRHGVARNLRLRITPALRFRADDALREGDRVADLIRHAVAEDRAFHADPAQVSDIRADGMKPDPEASPENDPRS